MTKPKNQIPIGAVRASYNKSDMATIVQYRGLKLLYLVAGEKLQIGQLVRLSKNGKVYRVNP